MINQKIYYLYSAGETTDWSHTKSLLHIGFRRWDTFTVVDTVRSDTCLGVIVGRYSFNADKDNGGKAKK